LSERAWTGRMQDSDGTGRDERLLLFFPAVWPKRCSSRPSGRGSRLRQNKAVAATHHTHPAFRRAGGRGRKDSRSCACAKMSNGTRMAGKPARAHGKKEEVSSQHTRTAHMPTQMHKIHSPFFLELDRRPALFATCPTGQTSVNYLCPGQTPAHRSRPAGGRKPPRSPPTKQAVIGTGPLIELAGNGGGGGECARAG